jgi:serine/threonine protein kinase
MMMELMDCDLHRVIQSKQPLSEKHHKCFIKQVLEAIKAMHAIGVFHRDLKPGNILVSKDCQVRITDFGLARFMDEPTRSGQNDVSPMTEYVVTRWYRCPELLLSPNRPYSEAIDLWSIGCILAELLRRKPLFPGKNHANQVQLIFEVLGYSGDEDLGFPVTGEAAAFLDKRCRYRKQPLKKFIPEASDPALALVETLLTVNPADRPTASVALAHPFLGDAEILNDYSKNYLQRPTVEYFNFEHEKFSVAELKAMIDNEVFTAAANAYRYPNKNNVVPPPNKISGAAFGSSSSSSAVHKSAVDSATPAVSSSSAAAASHSLTSAHSNQNLSNNNNNRGIAASNDENESMRENGPDNGPASQLATQMKNTRLDKASQRDNPFSNRTAVPPLRGGERGGSNPNPNSEREEDTKQQLQKFLRSEGDRPSVGPSGSLLTAVRNDMGPPNTRGRKSVPKTPSPQKMDLILQKDYQNKQRIAGNNNNDSNSGLMNSARSSSNNSLGGGGDRMSSSSGSGRGARSTFPDDNNISNSNSNNNMITAKRDSSRGIASDNNNYDNNPVAKKVPGKGGIMGMGMPFPSLTNRLKFSSAGSSSSSTANTSNNPSKTSIPANVFSGDSYVQHNNQPTAINRSAAMVHTGSHIINDNYGSSNQHN